MKDLQIVKNYHEQTKHHFHRFANSLGYMDWASQPDPFRRFIPLENLFLTGSAQTVRKRSSPPGFIGAELIKLPLQKEDTTPLYDDIFISGRIEPKPLTHETIANFFEFSLAISAWKQYQDSKWALRVNPSSGNLHPTEGYAILPPIKGISESCGVYHYAPKEHGLEKRAEFSKEIWSILPENIFFVGLTSICWREAWKYGERAFRYSEQDCGHAYMALDVAARMLGWRLQLISSISDEKLAILLGTSRKDEFKKFEEESPEILAAVHLEPRKIKPLLSIPEEFVESVKNSKWFGVANELSQDHHHWEIIDEVNKACLKPETKPFVSELWDKAYKISREHIYTSSQIIKRRRSAVDMDGKTSTTREKFYQVLLRVGTGFEGVPGKPRVHLGMFVHRVSGLKQGLYILVRDPEKTELFKSSMYPDFEWTRPSQCPPELHLYFLQEGNFIDISKSVSCMQDIAGDGIFSLGMVAEFDYSLHEFGPWFYKRLFWETGMIGQLLYLEAEAAELSATGMGCYFDDPFHEVFGFEGSKFQSLYHFTVGGAVIDSRLTTLPAYE